MIRLFNHHIHRHTLGEVLTDSMLLVVVIWVLLALQFGSVDILAPVATTHVLSFAAGVAVVGTASGIYQRSGSPTVLQTCARAVVMLFFALPLTYLAFALLPSAFPSRSSMQLAGVLAVAIVVLRRVYVTHHGSEGRGRTRVLIFGVGGTARVVGETLLASDPNVDIVGYFPGPNEKEAAVATSQVILDDAPLTETARRLAVDEIVVALTERRSGSMPMRQLLDCKLLGVKVYDVATHFEKRLGQIRIDFVNAGWLIFGDGFNQGALRSAIKRVFDITFSSLLIIVSAPIMVVTACAIKIDSRGPTLYRQQRVGLNGTTFMVCKFRSMRTDAEKDGTPQWATVRDNRITRVGQFIRKLRIDELPQLFNVLRGDMSLVGPRPERPYFVDQLTLTIPYFAARHSVKPGLTGWAQVRFKYGATIEDSQEKLQYDLYYVKNHSLLLDLVVLFETVGVVLTGKGAH